MDYLSAWCKSEKRLDSVTSIVTGANSGIGKETARDFYKRGSRVILACRNVKAAEQAKKELEEDEKNEQNLGTLIVEELDLSRLKSVREFAEKILKSEQKIGILVNNAGVMMCPEGRTEDGFEIQMGTNHFGHALLTLLLIPGLVNSKAARVVFVSSYLHQKYNLDLDDLNFGKTKYDPLKAYCFSKAGNVLFCRALANKLKEHDVTNVTTYSLHPGVINTGIGRHFSSTVIKGCTWVFNNVLYWFNKSPRCGAQTIIYCAVDEKCANESGLYYSECAVTLPSQQCRSDEAAAKLWEKTLHALNMDDFDL